MVSRGWRDAEASRRDRRGRDGRSWLGPGSFLEVRKILPLLTEVSPEHPSFHVVALSLPGFGFSEPVLKPGFAGRQYAELGNKLMIPPGYNEYGKGPRLTMQMLVR